MAAPLDGQCTEEIALEPQADERRLVDATLPTLAAPFRGVADAHGPGSDGLLNGLEIEPGDDGGLGRREESLGSRVHRLILYPTRDK